MTKQEEQWITGFAEGDGSVGVYHNNQPEVKFNQKERNVLDYISSIASGGHIYRHSPSDTYQMSYMGSHCMELLTIFSKHVVSEHFLQRLNYAPPFASLPLTTKHEPTLDWVIGFWDAEGTSQNARAGLHITIEQMQRDVLDTLQKLYKGGISRHKSMNSFQWRVYCTTARDLTTAILERSHNPTKTAQLHRHIEEYEQKALVREYIDKHHLTLETFTRTKEKPTPSSLHLDVGEGA